MKNQLKKEKLLFTLKTCSKSLFTLLVILVGLMPLKSSKAQATSVNIISQPLWGPTGYDYVEYYYLPEAEVYYNVPSHKFFYPVNGKWYYSNKLPANYNVDLYNTYKVVVHEPKPYKNHNAYKAKYAKYKTYHGKQYVIRDSRDKKYFVVKGHPGEAKEKAEKPKKSKDNSNSSKPSHSKGKSAKPNSSHGDNSHENHAKPNNSKGNSSHGNNSKGKGGGNH